MCGAVGQIMKMHLVGSLSRTDSCVSYPSGTRDTMTAVSKDLLSDPYLCICVYGSSLTFSWNILPS